MSVKPLKPFSLKSEQWLQAVQLDVGSTKSDSGKEYLGSPQGCADIGSHGINFTKERIEGHGGHRGLCCHEPRGG